MRFWPAIKNFKGGRENKLISKNIKSVLMHYFFREDDVLPSVPNNVNFNKLGDDKTIKIKINTNDYVDYQDFNWMNVNYFMSDFNKIEGTLEYTFWFVVKVEQTYGSMGGQVEYTLQLDTFHTFYDYFFNSSGNYEVIEMHNDRWVQDKDGNYIPNLIDCPYIANCNEYCSRYTHKHEYNKPYQMLDSKHFQYDLKLKDNKFITASGTTITEMVRGFVIIWCDLTESRDHVISVFDKVAVPYKVFIFPIYDEFKQADWAAGNKAIQKKYRVLGSSLVSDILEYDSIQPAEYEGWYESTSNAFKTSVSNLIVPREIFGQIATTPTDIRTRIVEPHIDSIAHTEYNMASIAKTSTKFDKLMLLANPANIIAPQTSTETDDPIKFDIDTYNSLDFNNITCYKRDGGDYKFMIKTKSGNVASQIKSTLDFSLVDFVNNCSIDDYKVDFDGGRAYFNYGGSVIWHGTHAESFIKTVAPNRKTLGEIYPVNDYPVINKVDDSKPGNTDAFWASKVLTWERHSDVPNGLQYCIISSRSATKKFPLFKFLKDTKYPEFTYNPEDLENYGPYNESVIGYNITGFGNGKYRADNWYVKYGNSVYELPIGQLQPKQTMNSTSDYFWYDDKITVLTKTIGFFSPEEMGLRNILLDTNTSTAEKLNNNSMILTIKGAYDYPYVDDAYTEYMKTNKNQFNAGYANIDATLSAREKSAWSTFGGGVLNGLANAAFGGPLNTARGVTEIGASIVNTVTSINSAKVEAANNRRTLDAQIADAKNMKDNIGVTGTSSTLTDTILKEFIQVNSLYQGYWNFWLPVLHKLELAMADRKSIESHFNKYGYKQDRIIHLNTLQDAMTRWAFNRFKITNADEIFLKNGISEWVAADVISDFTRGVWLWDADKIGYEDLMDFTINNYEVKFWIPPEERKYALETTLEVE
jgi:hypothetical protein